MPSRAETPDQSHAADEQPLEGVAAFTSVFAEHYGACLRTARRLVRDEGLAHDVVQEVFLSWWRAGGGSYRPDRGELAPWLSTLTHHKAVDLLRSADRQRRVLVAAEATRNSESEERLVEDVVWWELGRQNLMAALPTLPFKQQEVLGLAYGVGLTQVQIAERLGIPLGTVKSRTHAGMLRLRAALSSTWTPAGQHAAPPPEVADRPTLEPPLRALAVARSSAPAEGSVHEDVEGCATDLLRLAAEQADEASGAVAMIRRAAALLDTHGDGAAYALIVTLARRSVAAGAAATSVPTATSTSDDAAGVPHAD